MTNRKTLSDYGVSGTDLSRLDERIGEAIAIGEIMRNDSENYGVGFEVRYSAVLDEETGEIDSEPLRAVTFAKPLVRDFLRIVGEDRAPFTFDPPLLVRLTEDGKTFRMVDA